MSTRQIPTSWTQLKIKSIYKNKGNKHDFKNQRGLFLSQSISKIFEKLIVNRITYGLDNSIADFQNGARTKRGTSDNLFIIRMALDYYKYYRIPTYIVF